MINKNQFTFNNKKYDEKSRQIKNQKYRWGLIKFSTCQIKNAVVKKKSSLNQNKTQNRLLKKKTR